MDIQFRSTKLKKRCNEANAKSNDRNEKELGKRLDELRAAITLKDLRYLPSAHCHELKGNLKGKLAVNLVHPQRLIFEPFDDPIPTKPDGGLDWCKVRTIRICKIEDYHGRKKQ